MMKEMHENLRRDVYVDIPEDSSLECCKASSFKHGVICDVPLTTHI
jgi:hypothetical protein